MSDDERRELRLLGMYANARECGTGELVCRVCNGLGRIRVGLAAMQRCYRCGGTGIVRDA